MIFHWVIEFQVLSVTIYDPHPNWLRNVQVVDRAGQVKEKCVIAEVRIYRDTGEELPARPATDKSVLQNNNNSNGGTISCADCTIAKHLTRQQQLQLGKSKKKQ